LNHNPTTSPIHPNAIIGSNVEFGEALWVGAFASIGVQPEHRAHHNKEDGYGVLLGSGIVIREGVLVQSGIRRATNIGDDAFIMGNSTIGHDCILGENATVGPGCHLGGGCVIGRNVTLGMGTAVHQESKVGGFVMTSMNCAVKGSVPPFVMVVGPTGRISGINLIGLQRNGFGESWVEKYVSRLGDIQSGIIPTELPRKVKDVIDEWLNG